MQADAYSSYDGICLESKNTIVEVACWAHTRRYWHKAKEHEPTAAHEALSFITRLYEVERATSAVRSAKRKAARQRHAVPLLAEYETWLSAQAFLPKSQIGKALTYARNQWAAPNRYVEDGELSIDNNAAERAMRPIAIGRKNWMFVGSRAAVLMSLIGPTRKNERPRA